MRFGLRHLLVLASLAAPLSAARADGFSAMVVDAETGIMLVADQIDAPRAPKLLSRLTTIAMGIDDIAMGDLAAEEMIPLTAGQSMAAVEILQLTALGEDGYRGPMTVLAGRVGRNARIFSERLRAIQDSVGTRASSIEVGRARDGGPDFDGFTTQRDVVRVATSLLRSHPGLTDQVFGPATGNLPSTRIWMVEGDACLLSAKGPTTGRTLVVGLTGAPGARECFEKAATLLTQEDRRILNAHDQSADGPGSD